MAFEREFLSMMPHTVTVAPFVSRDVHGIPSYGTARTFRARVTGKVLSLRRSDRSDTTVVFDVYLDVTPGVTITTEDRLTLDGDLAWIKNTPIIFAVARVSDEDGHHHVKLQCGWQYHRQGQ